MEPGEAPPRSQTLASMFYQLLDDLSESESPLDLRKTIYERGYELAGHITGLEDFKLNSERILKEKDDKATLLLKIKTRQDTQILNLREAMKENSELLDDHRYLSKLLEEEAEKEKVTIGKLRDETSTLRNEVRRQNEKIDELTDVSKLYHQHLFQEQEKSRSLEVELGREKFDNDRLQQNLAHHMSDGVQLRRSLMDQEKMTIVVEKDMKEAAREFRAQMITSNHEHEEAIADLNEQAETDLATMRKNAMIEIKNRDDIIKVRDAELQKANARKDMYKSRSKAQTVELAATKEQLVEANNTISTLKESLDKVIEEGSLDDSGVILESGEIVEGSPEYHSEDPVIVKPEPGPAEDDTVCREEMINAAHEEILEPGLAEDEAAGKADTVGQEGLIDAAREDVSEPTSIFSFSPNSTDSLKASQQAPDASKTDATKHINPKKHEREEDESAEMGSLRGERRYKKAKKSKFGQELTTTKDVTSENIASEDITSEEPVATN